MPVTEELKREILERIKDCGCTKSIKCTDINFENLAPVKKIPNSDLLECRSENAKGCKFALPFGGTYFCQCPVRAWLFNELDM